MGLAFLSNKSIIFPWRCILMTTEDLQAIRAIVREETAKTNARLDAMQADIDQIKGDVGQVKGDIVQIKEDIVEIKEDGAITREAVNAIGDWTDAASEALKIRYPVER
jgi:DNA repair exonuclease SbcCD ATPase subunit